jgi:hypothetical protein
LYVFKLFIFASTASAAFHLSERGYSLRNSSYRAVASNQQLFRVDFRRKKKSQQWWAGKHCQDMGPRDHKVPARAAATALKSVPS